MKKGQAKLNPLDLKDRFSSHLCDITNKLLLQNCDERLGINGLQEIKLHPWLAGIDWRKLEGKNCSPPFKPYVNHYQLNYQLPYYFYTFTNQTSKNQENGEIPKFVKKDLSKREIQSKLI